MRKVFYAVALIILGAMAHEALRPMSALAQQPAPQVTPQPKPAPVQTKDIPPADATAIAPLLGKATDLQKQMQALVADYNAKIAPLRTELNGADGKSGVAHDLRLAEQKAFVDAGLDMNQYQIMKDATGKIVFAPRPQGIPQPQNR